MNKPQEVIEIEQEQFFSMIPTGMHLLGLDRWQWDLLITLLSLANGPKYPIVSNNLEIIALTLGEGKNPSGEYKSLSKRLTKLRDLGFIRKFETNDGIECISNKGFKFKKNRLKYDLTPLWKKCDKLPHPKKTQLLTMEY